MRELLLRVVAQNRMTLSNRMTNEPDPEFPLGSR